MKHGIVLTERCLTQDFFNKYFIKQFNSDGISVENSYFFKKDNSHCGIFLLNEKNLSEVKIYNNLHCAIDKMIEEEPYDHNLDTCIEKVFSSCKFTSLSDIIYPKIIGIYDNYFGNEFFNYMVSNHKATQK